MTIDQLLKRQTTRIYRVKIIHDFKLKYFNDKTVQYKSLNSLDTLLVMGIRSTVNDLVMVIDASIAPLSETIKIALWSQLGAKKELLTEEKLTDEAELNVLSAVKMKYEDFKFPDIH